MKRILIVDDSAVFRKILNLHLSNSDFDILEAVDGQDGLDKLQSDKVDLIVSDMNMPNMDGITFVKEIKKDPKNKFTPIIMLTTESQVEVKTKGWPLVLELGSRNHFLPKN